MEFLLQKVLMVLTYVHRRGPASVPAQLQDLAHACFVALRAADTCEVTLQSLAIVMLSKCVQAKGFRDGRNLTHVSLACRRRKPTASTLTAGTP